MVILNLQTGIENCIIRKVTKADIASAFGEEHMPVLATSKIVAFMEHVALASVQSYLPNGYSTVGIHINLHHNKPALEGDNLKCCSKLIEVRGRKLVFDISLNNDTEIIARATHTRMIINDSAFKRMISKNNVNR
jgi:predicted thioesterase